MKLPARPAFSLAILFLVFAAPTFLFADESPRPGPVVLRANVQLSPEEILALAEPLDLAATQRERLESIAAEAELARKELGRRLEGLEKSAHRLAEEQGGTESEREARAKELAAFREEAEICRAEIEAASVHAASEAMRALSVVQAGHEALEEALALKKLAAAEAGMERLARELAARFAERNEYPPSVPGDSPDSVSKESPTLAKAPAFSALDPPLSAAPGGLAGYPEDPFNHDVQAANTFSYRRHAPDLFVLASPGPDGAFNLELSAFFEKNPGPGVREALKPFSYDPANGTLSGGDIFFFSPDWPAGEGEQEQGSAEAPPAP